LGPTEYVVLGMVALRGPTTPYQLERAVGQSIGHFLPVRRSQFYAVPDRLATAGYLREEREQTGRRRRTYSITGRGRRAIRDWLDEPASGPMEVRDPGSLKLFFGELATPKQLAALAREQEAAYRTKLAELDEISSRFAGDGRRALRLAPLGLGVRIFETAIEYWSTIAAEPPGAAGADGAAPELGEAATVTPIGRRRRRP
jgi:DNA-binding PadR family transcriptional regulator